MAALTLFLAPIAAGLVYTWLPAFGWFPARGTDSLTLMHWREMLSSPGLGGRVRLTLTTGMLTTAVLLALVIGFVAARQGTRTMIRVRRFSGCAASWCRCWRCRT